MTFSMIRKVVLGAAVAVTGAGAAMAERGADGALNLLYWQPLGLLNPYLSNTFKDLHGASVVLEPLARYDESGAIVPTLVVDVPTVENGGVAADLTSITWKLRPDILWSDGSPFTSADVAFTYEYCQAPSSGCAQAANFAGIKEVAAVDPQTVKITFSEAKPFPYSAFVGAFTPILQKAQFANCVGEKAASCTDQNFKPIGTGPFRVTDFVPNDVAVFEANPNYRDASKPAFGSLVIKGGGDAAAAARAVFQTGEVDFAWNLQVPPDVLQSLAAGGAGVVETAFGSAVEFLTLNLANIDPALGDKRSSLEAGPHPFNGDPAVRRALSLAIDRQALAEVNYGATGTATCNIAAAPEVYASTNTAWCLKPDVAEANRLLDEAGWVRGADGIRAKDGVRLSVNYATTVNPVRQDLQAMIKAMWAEIGVDTALRAIDAGAFFSNAAGNPDSVFSFYFDVVMYYDSFTGIDPEAFMATRICDQSPSLANNWTGNNISRYCDPEYDALVKKLAATAPLAERGEIVRQQNDLLIDRGGIIPLVHRASVSGRAVTLEGVRLNAWDSELWNIADWSRAK